MLHSDQVSELSALRPGESTEDGATRRTALKVALGVGYAAATMPIMAQTAIKTSADSLTTGETTCSVNGFKVPMFYAAPAGKKNLPVVLVIQEIFGVHEYIADTCRRFAKAGYLAIAPELFARQGDPTQYGEMAKLISEVVSKVPDAQVMTDLDGVVKWAGENGGNLGQVAITGFCWGGRIVWLYSAHNPNLKAGVAWYGRLVGDKDALRTSQPVDIAGQMKAPVLGLYGGKDTGIPVATVDQMKTALTSGSAAAKASSFIVYPEAPHAFHADYRPSFRAAEAKEAWEQAQAWFKKYL